MSIEFTDRCMECERVVRKPDLFAASGMVAAHVYFLYLGAEPSILTLGGREITRYCPACLKKVLVAWLDSLPQLT